jgi:hypothetical protein
MSISGHKTRSIFDRYNITSETDLREAIQRSNGITKRNGRRLFLCRASESV